MVTSDRIAVMNQGRIEQVDDPHTLYTRPKTRFVAERAYLGEFWDYVVVPTGGAPRPKVTAAPLAIFEVGDAAWLEFDLQQMAPIA
jgi:ABC-type Fe3+/spermidine/putrescine transport system ATPase subunit